MFGTTVGAIPQMEFGLCEAISPYIVCDQLDVFLASSDGALAVDVITRCSVALAAVDAPKLPVPPGSRS